MPEHAMLDCDGNPLCVGDIVVWVSHSLGASRIGQRFKIVELVEETATIRLDCISTGTFSPHRVRKIRAATKRNLPEWF